MQVEPSSIPCLELIGPDAGGFKQAIESLLGRAPDELLQPALAYSVIATNRDTRAVALLGVRFNMTGCNGKPYSVIHYADTLRNPERASIAPCGMRFVCVEPLYTDLVLRRGREIDQRGPMNLKNLRKALRVSASLDCAAFSDGQFAGPDSLGAFERLARERDGEMALIEKAVDRDGEIEAVLRDAMEASAPAAQRALARRLAEALAEGGVDEVALRARNHRLRIRLSRDQRGAVPRDMR